MEPGNGQQMRDAVSLIKLLRLFLQPFLRSKHHGLQKSAVFFIKHMFIYIHDFFAKDKKAFPDMTGMHRQHLCALRKKGTGDPFPLIIKPAVKLSRIGWFF